MQIGSIALLVVLSAVPLMAGPVADKIREHVLATFDLDPELTGIVCRPEIDSMTMDSATHIMINCRAYPPPQGTLMIKVILQDPSGDEHAIATSVEVHNYQKVLVATRRIKSREPLGPSDFTLKIMEIDQLPGEPVGDYEAIEGMRAAQTISSGRILVDRMLEPIPVVSRGDRVRILYQSPWLRVESFGIAKADAVEGELVEVKNEISGKLIYGRAAADGTVCVER